MMPLENPLTIGMPQSQAPKAPRDLPFTLENPGFRFSRGDAAKLAQMLGMRVDRVEFAKVVFPHLHKLSQGIPAAHWGVPTWARKGIREFILGFVDDRLQDLYRGRLASVGVPAGLGQEERMALLAPIESQARSIVARIDWQGMADWLGLPGGGAALKARLSALPLAEPSVGFVTSYLCNARCRHCCNFSGPGRKEPHLSLDRMRGLIAEMPEYGLSIVHVSGGEPFIYFEECLDLVRAARATGVQAITFMTNGFWAKSSEAASASLQRLLEAGFNPAHGDRIMVSAGAFYDPFVDPSRVGYLAAAYRGMFGQPLKVRLKADQHDADGYVRARDRLAKAGVFDTAVVDVENVSLAGRAEDMTPQGEDEIDRSCDIAMSLTITPDGTLRTCCGYHGEVEGLSLAPPGNSLSLGELILRVVNDPIAQFLQRRPVRELLDLIDAKPGQTALSDRCGPCRHALANSKDRAALEERLFPLQRYYPFWFQKG